MSPTTPHTQDLRELIEWENVRHYRKLHESAWSDAIRAILPRLQKALSGIPSTTDARRVFMDGLEWEMVFVSLLVDQENFLHSSPSQNDAYYVIGTAQHCTIRLGQLPLQGIRMCSAYVQSAKFRSRDTESLRVFAEDFLEMFPIPPDVVQRIFDHMWWEDVVAYGKRGFPAPNVSAMSR